MPMPRLMNPGPAIVLSILPVRIKVRGCDGASPPKRTNSLAAAKTLLMFRFSEASRSSVESEKGSEGGVKATKDALIRS